MKHDQIGLPAPVTLVMYHYVRPIPDQNGFRVKGMTPEVFAGQLDYIERHYTVCSVADVMSASRGERELPPRPLVLTFDDGLAEHASTVWPMLRARGWSGAFFAAADPVFNGRFLDVHRIHLLLASKIDPGLLKSQVVDLIREIAAEEDPTVEELWGRYGVPGRFDGPDVNFLKRALQKGLSEPTRREIVRTLFRRHVTEYEEELARDFYTGFDDFVRMVDDGMHVGGHGIRHEWLDSLGDADLAAEIEGSRDFVRRVHGGVEPDDWSFCYPYGGHDDRTRRALEDAGCAAAFTIEVALAAPGADMLRLPRIDCNDLPLRRDAPLAPWTRRAGPIAPTDRSSGSPGGRSGPLSLHRATSRDRHQVGPSLRSDGLGRDASHP